VDDLPTHEQQPKTVYGDPVTDVHIIYPTMRWQAIAQWSDTYKAYIVKAEDRMPWTPEGARTWQPY